METKKKALGKGLEQLFANNMIDFESTNINVINDNDKKNVIDINISDIRSNPYQPRKVFDEDSLKELAESIKTYGIVQPIVVKKSIQGYELVAGERRTKASKLAGLTKIPALVKDFSDQEMMEIALLENLQREDLNPIEVADSIEKIIKLQNLTHEEFSDKIGKSRSYVTNILGLLKLPEVVKEHIAYKNISMSHAKILSKLTDEEKIINLCNKIIKEGLSVHALEKLMIEKEEVLKAEPTNQYNLYEKMISDYFDEKVKISKNKLEIKFDDHNDLIRILNLMNIKLEDE